MNVDKQDTSRYPSQLLALVVGGGKQTKEKMTQVFGSYLLDVTF